MYNTFTCYNINIQQKYLYDRDDRRDSAIISLDAPLSHSFHTHMHTENPCVYIYLHKFVLAMLLLLPFEYVTSKEV